MNFSEKLSRINKHDVEDLFRFLNDTTHEDVLGPGASVSSACVPTNCNLSKVESVIAYERRDIVTDTRTIERQRKHFYLKAYDHSSVMDLDYSLKVFLNNDFYRRFFSFQYCT